MEADSLAKVTSVDKLVDNQIKVQYILSVDVPEVHQIDKEANWTTPTVSYLKDRLLLDDREEASWGLEWQNLSSWTRYRIKGVSLSPT